MDKLKALSEGSSSSDENKKEEFKKILKAATDSGIKFKFNTIIELYSKLWFDPDKFSRDCGVSINDVCSDYKK